MDFEKFLYQNIKTIKEKISLDLIKQKDDYGNILLHYVNGDDFAAPGSPIIKYILKFYKRNNPSLVFLKNNDGHTIINWIPPYHSIKFVYKFCILYFPYVLLELRLTPFEYNFFGHLIHIKYVINYLKYNFPEMSRRTNNFILPLLMEIQN